MKKEMCYLKIKYDLLENMLTFLKCIISVQIQECKTYFYEYATSVYIEEYVIKRNIYDKKVNMKQIKHQ